MKQDKSAFKKLLNRLQEDSWQLELLISGFAIFGLFYAIEPVLQYLINARLNGNELATKFYQVVYLSIYILIFNLIFHVLLRGLWIGSLGLRYVSGEIEYDQLNYSEKFTKYLKKKVGSFDDYISKLENISSIMFAISFLLIFYVLSFYIVTFFIINNIGYLTSIIPINWLRKSIALLSSLLPLGAIIVFIDFVTQGLLKKNKWVSKIYFPFYWVFSFLTLSFLYRPLVYNLLDNKFGKRISLILFPVYVIILLASTLQYQVSNILPLRAINNSTNNIANANNYKDIVNSNDYIFVDYFAIPSKVITTPYLKIEIPLRKQLEEDLITFNPDLKKGKDIRGYYSSFNFTVNHVDVNKFKAMNIDSLTGVYLNTFKQFYSFKIDNSTRKTDFTLSANDDDLRIETYIGIKDLQEGKHIVEFQKLKHKDTDSIVSILKVPFWYYKD